MASLQDQLLKAGLVSKDKATKIKSAKRKQAKINKKHKLNQEDESKLAAEKLMADQAEKARQLNQQKNQQAEQIAIQAQIKQLIETNRQDHGKPQLSFNFEDKGKIKKLEVSQKIHQHITNGLLAIARIEKSSQIVDYALVPKMVAAKIKQRSDHHILELKLEQEVISEKDPYADYQIPDDLMW